VQRRSTWKSWTLRGCAGEWRFESGIGQKANQFSQPVAFPRGGNVVKLNEIEKANNQDAESRRLSKLCQATFA
jgi:hypothetical protein